MELSVKPLEETLDSVVELTDVRLLYTFVHQRVWQILSGHNNSTLL